MIIAVSIVDLHRKGDAANVGMYQFEVDHPNDSHFSLLAVVCPAEAESTARKLGFNKLIPLEEIRKSGKTTRIPVLP